MTAVIPLKIKIVLLTTVAFWASAFVGIRAGLHGYSPGGLALLRFIIASICMFFIYFFFAERKPIPFKDKLSLLLIGGAGIGIYNITLNYGEISIASGISSFIISQSPIITTLLAVIFYEEKISVVGVIGMLISILGVSLISLGETNGFNFHIGLFYLLTATIVGATYSVLQKPFLNKYHAVDVAAYLVWGGSLVLLVFIPNLIHDLSVAPRSATLATIYLGVFPAAVAYVAWSYVLARVPASRAVSFLYFMPVIATFIGWIWLNEIPVWLSLIGGIVALTGVWIVNQSYKKNKPLKL